MKQINRDEIKELINNYELLVGEEKKKATGNIEKFWHELADKFMRLCESDEVLKSAYDEIKKSEKALSFDIVEDTAFRKIDKIYNEKDPENRYVHYCLDEDRFNQAKVCYENWESIKLELESKINKIKNKKLLPFKREKIQKVEKEILAKEQLIKDYKYYLQKKELKDYYEARKGELEKIIAEYKRILYEYAKQVAFEGIKEHPNVLCFSQSAFSSSKYERNFDIGCLKSVLDEIRFEVLLDKQDEVEMAE